MQCVHTLPRVVALPLAATAVASVGFSFTPLISAGLPRLFGFAGIAIAAILTVAAAQGAKQGFLAGVLTVLAADYFFLGPPLEFGLSKPCHYAVVAIVGVASTLGASWIEMRRSARATQLAQPVGMALPDSNDVLICSPSSEGIKVVRIVRDI